MNQNEAESAPFYDSVVWAVNMGGAEHVGIDGVHYQADKTVSDGNTGQIGRVLGTQDDFIYRSYRSGDFSIQQPIANGTYNITFLFAEPEDIETGARIFSVFAEGHRVIRQLDVRRTRDGNHKSALTRSVTDVVVSDGQLDIDFEAIRGPPLLNAMVVRGKREDPQHWELVWGDEFNYEGSPDPNKWDIDVWPAGKVNREDQAYTDRARNIRVDNGNLVIEAHLENYGNARYSSGRIHSLGKGDFLYGRVDIRARLPAGQGTWSALWMLPSDPFRYSTSCNPDEEWQGNPNCDAWPNSGEIDIMEHVGYDMHNVHGTVHNKAFYYVNHQQRKGSIDARNVDSAFHVYSMEWAPGYINIFFDDNLYFTYMNESAGWRAWPYDHPYHIIMNLAIGGDWGRAGGPIDNSIFPAKLEVDYVRVFKFANTQTLR